MSDTADLIPFAHGELRFRKGQWRSENARLIKSQRVNLLGKNIAYRELGAGDPIVFVHGNWTSANLWRKVLVPIASMGRCLAIDLPGFGGSDGFSEEEIGDGFFELFQLYFDAFMESVAANSNVTLVVIGSGSLIACDWAYRHQDRVRGIVHSSACFADPLMLAGDDDYEQFCTDTLREIILKDPEFYDRVLPGFVKHSFFGERLQGVKEGFLHPPPNRYSALALTELIPSKGKPRAMHELVLRYTNWMQYTDVAKLCFKPSIDIGDLFNSFQTVANGFCDQQIVTLEGGYFLPEESAESFVAEMLCWLDSFR